MKKKFFGLLVTSLLVLSLGLFSTSYAYTFDDFVNYLTAVSNGDISIDSSQLKNYGIPYFLRNVNNIKNTFNVDNYTNFILTRGNYFYFTMSNDNMNVNIVYDTNFSINGFTTNANCTVKSSSISDSSTNKAINQIPINAFTVNINDTIGLVTGSYPSNKGYFNLYNPEPDVYLIPDHDYIVSVNNTNDVNCLLRNWSIYQWELGDTYNFIDLDSYAMYLYDLNNSVEIGTVFGNNNENIITNNGALFYNTDGNLYANSRLMEHNVLYRLYIEKWIDSIQYNEEHYFIFLPRNAVVSNGQIINIGSGDFNVQDSTNNIIDNVNDTEAFENVMNELSQSGELVKRLDYKVYPNHSYDILFALTQNICDTLYASGDTYIDVNIHGYQHRFYASDFYIPTNQLTVWIQMAIVFGYCYLLYKQASELIHAIQEGDLYVLELEDATEYFYM